MRGELTFSLEKWNLSQLQDEVVHNMNGYEPVTCGQCGEPFFLNQNKHRVKDPNMPHDVTELVVKCPLCGYYGDQCDFPDLFY